MTVPQPDRFLIHGDFTDPEGIPSDQIWITRHFNPKKEGLRFAIYFLKMRRLFHERSEKEFVDLYQGHTGSDHPHRRYLRKCLKRILKLELAMRKANAAGDMQQVYILTSGKYERHNS